MRQELERGDGPSFSFQVYSPSDRHKHTKSQAEPETQVDGDPGSGKALSGGLNTQGGLDGPLGAGRGNSPSFHTAGRSGCWDTAKPLGSMGLESEGLIWSEV